MVNFNTGGPYALVNDMTWDYLPDVAANYFKNAWDTNTPSYVEVGGYPKFDTVGNGVCGNYATAPTVESEPSLAPDIPGTAPGALASKLYDGNQGGWVFDKTVVGVPGQPGPFIDGGILPGTTYTQTATQTKTSNSYISDVKGPYNNSSCNGQTTATGTYYKVTTKTKTDSWTLTYTYNITPKDPYGSTPVNGIPTDGSESYTTGDYGTVFKFVSASGDTTAHVTFNADIAGESAVYGTWQGKTGIKYSFSLNPVYDSTGAEISSRVRNLVVTINGTPYSAGSTVVENESNVSPTATNGQGQVVFGPNGELDFWYKQNAGSNGNISLLVDSADARTLLNNDVFAGNNNGGSDGSALAIAVMDPVAVDLAPGSYTVTLTGTVKENDASTGDISFSVTNQVNIIAHIKGQ